MATTTRALVLGGGGVIGVAWESLLMDPTRRREALEAGREHGRREAGSPALAAWRH